MAAITWRSLMGQTADPVRAMAAAQDSFNGMFGTLNKVIESRNNSMEEASKQGFLNELYGAQSVEGFDQSRDSLAGKLQGLSAENQAAVRPLLEQRRAQLMQSTLAGQQYEDAQQTRGQQDVINALNEARTRATDPDEINRLEQAASIYQSNNLLNSQGALAVTEGLQKRGIELDNQAWTNQERGQKQLEWDHLAKTRPQEIQMADANIAKANADAERLRAIARGEAGGAKPQLGTARTVQKDIQESEMAPLIASISNSIFSGSPIDSEDGRKQLQTQLERTGVAWYSAANPTNAVDKVLNELANEKGGIVSQDMKEVFVTGPDKKPVKLPLTSNLLSRAIDHAYYNNVGSPSISDIKDSLKTLMKSPDISDKLVEYLENKAKQATLRDQHNAANAALLGLAYGARGAIPEDEDDLKK